MLKWIKDMFMSPKIDDGKVDDKWEISAIQAIEKYGTAEKALIAMWKDHPVAGFSAVDMLLYAYLREQYYKKNPE